MNINTMVLLVIIMVNNIDIFDKLVLIHQL